jgi:hypothetical protein
MGATWFISYIGILTVIHHFVLFLLEASDFGLIIPVLIKTLASTIFTTAIVIVVQFFRRD